MSNLSPDQFFHGTKSDIHDAVLPAQVAGSRVSGYSEGDPGKMSGGDHAFAIKNDEDYAWRAAIRFHPGRERSRVYTVEPAEDMKPGPWNPDHKDFHRHAQSAGKDPGKVGMDEYGSKTGFKVTGQIDIAPGHQGTFPDVNWNDHAKGGGHNYDANHPDDRQIKWGGLGGLPDELDVAQATPRHVSNAVDWRKDAPKHSAMREMAGRPQREWAKLF